jgi:hypothetical protein
MISPKGLKIIGRKIVSNGNPTKSIKQIIIYNQPIAGRQKLFAQCSSITLGWLFPANAAKSAVFTVVCVLLVFVVVPELAIIVGGAIGAGGGENDGGGGAITGGGAMLGISDFLFILLGSMTKSSSSTLALLPVAISSLAIFSRLLYNWCFVVFL